MTERIGDKAAHAAVFAACRLRRRKFAWRETAVLAACLNLLQAAPAIAAEGDDSQAAGGLKLGGYLRTWASMNLQNQPDTPQYDDRYKLAMLRGAVSLVGDFKTGSIAWHASARTDQELMTDYQRVLQNAARASSPGGPASNVLGEYRKTDLREFYADFDIGERVHMRLGKQQVVWGETDLFHPTDLIQGFDYRWRFFLEGEPDELRKSLIMINAQIKVPEVNGSLQTVLRPGLDRREDIGNTYAFSGRWAQSPGKGFDPLAPGSGGGDAPAFSYDYDHPAGRYKAPTGGLRWTSVVGPINYSVSALRTFAPEPVLNPAAKPYQKKPTGAFADIFYPLIKVYSVSASGEIAALDTVANVEIAYQKGNLFNSGFAGAASGLAGGPVLEKNVVQTTLRFDKTLRLTELLGTSGASLSSLQIFDTATLGLKDSEQIVNAAGHALPIRKHKTVVSYFFSLPYLSGTVEPGLLFARYMQSGDMLFVPTLKFSMGTNWRFLLEADIFKAKHQDLPGKPDPRFENLGGFAKSNQLLFRATYQF